MTLLERLAIGIFVFLAVLAAATLVLSLWP